MDEKLMERIALMERELSTLRARPAEQKFDANAFISAMMVDPHGTLAKMGARKDHLDHLTKVFVANAMGNEAPPQLQMLAAMGPQVNATHALDSKLEALSRQFSELTESQKRNGVRESFKALTADKVKYPHLSKAYAANPALFDEALNGTGTAEEIAKTMEERHAAIAKIYAPTPAASENADTATTQSTQSQPAAGGIDPTPPPIPKASTGVWSEAEHVRLRDELVRKYTSTPQ